MAKHLEQDVARLTGLATPLATAILRAAQQGQPRVLAAATVCLADAIGADGTAKHNEIVALAFLELGAEQWTSPVCRNHLQSYESQPRFTVIKRI